MKLTLRAVPADDVRDSPRGPPVAAALEPETDPLPNETEPAVEDPSPPEQSPVQPIPSSAHAARLEEIPALAVKVAKLVGRGQDKTVFAGTIQTSSDSEKHQVAVLVFKSAGTAAQSVVEEAKFIAQAGTHCNLVKFFGVCSALPPPADAAIRDSAGWKDPSVALISELASHGSLDAVLEASATAGGLPEDSRLQVSGDAQHCFQPS